MTRQRECPVFFRRNGRGYQITILSLSYRMIMCYDSAKTVIGLPGMGLCGGVGLPTAIYKLTHIWVGHMDYTELLLNLEKVRDIFLKHRITKNVTR
jgi:hypothetical protein